MANRDSYVEFLLEQLAPLGEVTTRRMFGGHVMYCDGIVFALVASNALYLKADDHNRPAFVSRDLQPFHPFGDQTASMQYYQAPPEIFEDRDALETWAGGAVAAGRRAHSKKRANKRKRAVSGR
jgi:DNA transformation protein